MYNVLKWNDDYDDYLPARDAAGKVIAFEHYEDAANAAYDMSVKNPDGLYKVGYSKRRTRKRA